jgi:hypothetical protein
LAWPPKSGKAPVAVNKYLLPREIQVATVRQHPVVLLVPAAQAVAGLTLGIILTAALPESRPQLAAIWIAVSLLILYAIRTALRWAVDYLVVTSERVMLTVGFLHRSVIQTPLHEMLHLSFVRTFGGRLFGYGALVNGRQVISDFVPYPEQLYLLIEGLLYPTAVDEDEPAADGPSEPAGDL